MERRVEIKGPGKYEIVGKSQSFLGMIVHNNFAGTRRRGPGARAQQRAGGGAGVGGWPPTLDRGGELIFCLPACLPA
jgi:hypothetical protein